MGAEEPDRTQLTGANRDKPVAKEHALVNAQPLRV